MTVATIDSNPASVGAKIEYANALAASNLIPRHYQKQPANVLVAVELGNALGIAPIVAINEVNVINGSPSLSASLMAALARQAGHKVRVTGDQETATCTIVRADDPDFEHTATWDKKKAQAAGLWGKGHWAKDAGTMLRWRAISECVRFACSEVLGGVRYTPEEVADFNGGNATVTAAPVLEQEGPAPKPISLTEAIAQRQQPNLRTEKQSTMLFAYAKQVGLESRDDLMPYIEMKIGHSIESTKQLTFDEATYLIESLQTAAEDQANPVTGEDVEPVDAELVDDWTETAEVRA